MYTVQWGTTRGVSLLRSNVSCPYTHLHGGESKHTYIHTELFCESENAADDNIHDKLKEKTVLCYGGILLEGLCPCDPLEQRYSNCDVRVKAELYLHTRVQNGCRTYCAVV